MYFDKETNEEPLSVMEIQGRHPLTMMPQHLERYEFIEPAATPSYNPETQKPVSVKSAIVDGVRRQQWSVVPLSEDELKSRISASCTPAQGLVALYALKDITEDDLHAAIELIEDPVQRYTARIGLARATEWRRESPTMALLASLLDLTEADLDALFAYAVTVQV